jgi:methylenetetrahydrofolate dehydrogenase (NADP+)/methenyltetrahydrofolate cyclohydrolase
VIDGKAVAAEVRERVASGVQEFAAANDGHVPGLATVLVGDDPASQVYVGNKRKQTEAVGMRSIHEELGSGTPEDELLELIASLNDDESVDGILVQLPLPEQIDADSIVAAVDPAKDVDGLTPVNAGRLSQGQPGLVPCTPRGVGLLLQENATVTVCHSRTRDLAAVCSRADVLIAAVGSPRLIGAEMVKPGATVIDVGINRTDDGLVGDVDFEAAAEVAGAITPVPGGVGPMTIAMLLSNTLLAASNRRP